MKNGIVGAGLFACLVLLVAVGPAPAGQAAKRLPKVIKLDAGGQAYLRVLGGPPETSTMRSGLVTLAPGASVGRHNTEQYEEMIIVLEGRGEIRFTARPPLPLENGTAAYCPPRTDHDVFNNGATPLRYIYVVAEEKVTGR